MLKTYWYLQKSGRTVISLGQKLLLDLTFCINMCLVREILCLSVATMIVVLLLFQLSFAATNLIGFGSTEESGCKGDVRVFEIFLVLVMFYIYFYTITKSMRAL